MRVDSVINIVGWYEGSSFNLLEIWVSILIHGWSSSGCQSKGEGKRSEGDPAAQAGEKQDCVFRTSLLGPAQSSSWNVPVMSLRMWTCSSDMFLGSVGLFSLTCLCTKRKGYRWRLIRRRSGKMGSFLYTEKSEVSQEWGSRRSRSRVQPAIHSLVFSTRAETSAD